MGRDYPKKKSVKYTICRKHYRQIYPRLILGRNLVGHALLKDYSANNVISACNTEGFFLFLRV